MRPIATVEKYVELRPVIDNRFELSPLERWLYLLQEILKEPVEEAETLLNEDFAEIEASLEDLRHRVRTRYS